MWVFQRKADTFVEKPKWFFNLLSSRSTTANHDIHLPVQTWNSSTWAEGWHMGEVQIHQEWAMTHLFASSCLATGKIIAKEAMSRTHGWRWRICTGFLQGKEIKKEMAGTDKIPSPLSCQTGDFCFRNRWEENPLHSYARGGRGAWNKVLLTSALCLWQPDSVMGRADNRRPFISSANTQRQEFPFLKRFNDRALETG